MKKVVVHYLEKVATLLAVVPEVAHMGCTLNNVFFYATETQLNEILKFKQGDEYNGEIEELLQKQDEKDSFTAVRKKGKSKIHLHAGHQFVVHTYVTPTWCGHCEQLLWGMKSQGWQCKVCGFNVHKKGDVNGKATCHLELRSTCSGVAPGTLKQLKQQTKRNSLKKGSGQGTSSPSTMRRNGSNVSTSSAGRPGGRSATMSGGLSGMGKKIAAFNEEQDSGSDDEEDDMRELQKLRNRATKLMDVEMPAAGFEVNEASLKAMKEFTWKSW